MKPYVDDLSLNTTEQQLAAIAAVNEKSVDGRDLTVNEAVPPAAGEVKEIRASRTSFPRISHLARMPR